MVHTVSWQRSKNSVLHFSSHLTVFAEESNKIAVWLCLQGQRRGRCSGSGMLRSPQFSSHGLKESLWLLPAPRGLLLSGSTGRAVHPAVAGEQAEASAPDPGGWGAVQAPPAEQEEEEGQCAAAGHAQPRDLMALSRIGVVGPCSDPSLQPSISSVQSSVNADLRSRSCSDGPRFLTYHPLIIPNAGGWAGLTYSLCAEVRRVDARVGKPIVLWRNRPYGVTDPALHGPQTCPGSSYPTPDGWEESHLVLTLVLTYVFCVSATRQHSFEINSPETLFCGGQRFSDMRLFEDLEGLNAQC